MSISDVVRGFSELISAVMREINTALEIISETLKISF